MKESEFIELLNLYLDHEISAKDAARLEAEVTGSTQHRRVYQQYCRIHRACTLLAGQWREGAPERLAALGDARRQRHAIRWNLPIYATGLAAACFAAFVVVRSHRQAQVDDAMASAPAFAEATAGVAAAPAAAPAPAPAPAPVQTELHSVVDLHNFSLASDSANNGLLTAEQNDLFAWMKQVQMAPMQRPSVRQFSVPAALLQPAAPAPRSSDLGAPVEMAAFRFQR